MKGKVRWSLIIISVIFFKLTYEVSTDRPLSVNTLEDIVKIGNYRLRFFTSRS